MGIFYLPMDGVCGDFIPFYNEDRGCYELYYLHDYRKIREYGEGTDWRRITTLDMVNFTEEGEVIIRGTREDQDLFCFTGCVVRGNGMYHIFYTGHNYHLTEIGKNREAVMHAVSADGKHWEKKPEDTFYALDGEESLERDDWRDPFVFYQKEEQKWWMLLCTRKKKGALRRRGATGLLKSEDLKRWHYEGSFWEPYMCWCPECPDLFQWGEYWYFIYSTFHETQGMRTYYRMARSLDGPWKNPGNNCFDGRAFYAGKTASNGQERYLFGWNPTKEGNRDEGSWQWGGNLVVHRLNKESDGCLTVSAPQEVVNAYTEEQQISICLADGAYAMEEDGFSLFQESGFASVFINNIPDQCMLSFSLFLSEGTDSAGVLLRTDYAGNEGYYMRLEPKKKRLVFDREPAYPHERAEIEQFADVEAGRWHSVRILIDETIALAYVDDKYALSARMYDFKGNGCLIYVNDGKVRIRDLHLLRMP